MRAIKTLQLALFLLLLPWLWMFTRDFFLDARAQQAEPAWMHIDLYLLPPQLLYPVFWIFTRRKAWSIPWRVLRGIHLALVSALWLLIGLFFLIAALDEGWKN